MAFPKQQLEQKFNEVYQQLNQQQKIAVDTLEGPVMVIAGPGTGKTQILAARIGKILLDTDALPENILCLTYTDAGVVAMRRRLQQFIGADAYKVNIYTFHAFCNDVIQDHLSLFEKNALDPVSELERIELFKKLIDSFPRNHPLKRYRGDVYFEAPHLQQLFSTMKREGWTPEWINRKIDEYINDLPLRDEYIAKRATKEFKKGDLRTDKIAEATEKMERVRAAINEFNTFQQLMNDKRRYDFDDMINWVIRAFEENRPLLADYQERYQYILVDEFQDTSGTQNRIIQLLISYWEQPNIFVVGDDDQSIYRFQGANVQNMLDFAQQYQQDLKTIVLTSNYRSIQPILDLSKSVITRNTERLTTQLPGLSKELVAANEAINHLTDPPELIEYNSEKEEMAGICQEVDQLIRKGVAPGRIAVIYKENKYGEALAGYLQLMQIPVFSKRPVNLLQHPFIKKILSVLRYLNAEHDIPYGGDQLLFEILHYDFYAIPPIEIAKLNTEVNRRQYKGEATSLRQLLYEKAHAPARDLFDTGIHPELKNCSAVYEQLIADVSNVTLQQLVENIIRTAGVLPYIMQHAEKAALMQYLSAFFDFVKEENSRDPQLNLDGLISTIDMMEKEDIPLSMIRTIGNDMGVNLLTAHGSKGLEFEYVFLAGTNASYWEKKKTFPALFRLPDTVFSSQPEGDSLQELRRVFYVAITRAEKHLYISYAKFNNAGKELEPSLFIAEILEQHDLKIQSREIAPDSMTRFRQLQFIAQAPSIESNEENFIAPLLEKFVMNVTALNSYLDCPLKFYYQNLLRIPSGKNENTEFGSAIHFALERFFRKMREDENNNFPPVQTLYDDFKWYMRRHRQNFTKETFDRRMEQGAIILPEYYNNYIGAWNKVVMVELNIKNVVVNGVPLKGKLDKLEFNGKEVNVVDYKTGSIKYAQPKLKPPSEKDPNGGDYWRQAVFYKLLVDHYDQKNWTVTSTEFDFIEPDEKKNFIKQKIIILPEHLEIVKQQITDTWQRIQNREFYKGCGKADCHWCNFVKDNRLYTGLEEIEEEDI
ncbi:DNA helicase UvrD [Niabella ginsenosidivorans]|uniref:DNA 3'-5' helicase n=1 Tax=Niabella ginsenosidivorans TaxID=1176587 RepID=A0A1A9I5M6_9BACT|nr:ATP-dependent DNA helicase [Niabella ginsenosidivorans]ANH82635.1 DNA helicase UvrD [Niabella ginsenosidivorans]